MVRVLFMITQIGDNNMSWKNTIKKDGRDMDSEEYDYYYGDGSKGDIPRNPPKGKERIKIVKDIFSEVDDAKDILQAASSWSSPETYERIEKKLSELVKEIKALEKEALEYHGKE